MTSSSLASVRKVARGNLRAVHIIRDPIAVVISGYVYHTYSKDSAPVGLKRLSLGDGIAHEAQVALAGTLPEMLGAYTESQMNNDVLTVRLEDFMASSADYDVAVERIYNFTVGDFLDREELLALKQLATREDLARRPFTTDHSSSLADPKLTRDAWTALVGLPMDLLNQLLEYRGALGYA